MLLRGPLSSGEEQNIFDQQGKTTCVYRNRRFVRAAFRVRHRATQVHCTTAEPGHASQWRFPLRYSRAIRGQRTRTGKAYDPRQHAEASTGSSSGDIRQALELELSRAGLLSTDSATRITGTLMENELDGRGFSEGRAAIAVEFVVHREGREAYRATKSVQNTWDLLSRAPKPYRLPRKVTR